MISDQFHFNEQVVLYTLIESSFPAGGKILEIGSWTGASTIILATLAQQNNARVFCVDTWKGTPGTPLEGIASNKDILTEFRNNLNVDGLLDFVVPIQCDSSLIAPMFADRTFDVIFIDGSHRYSQVKSDIVNLMPKVKLGGLLCGHDAEYKYSECTEEKRKLLETYKEEDYSPLLRCHPGVIVALSEVFNDRHSIVSTRIWYVTGNLC